MSIGPVQLLVVAFDQPNFTGEILEELAYLRDNDQIRLIDALVVQKSGSGSIEALRWSDLSIDEAEDFGATVGALLGLGLAGDEGAEAGAIAGFEAGSDGHVIDDAQVWDVADAIPDDSAAAIALIEHVWAKPLRGAIARAGGVVVSGEFVHPLDLIDVGLLTAAELELETS